MTIDHSTYTDVQDLAESGLNDNEGVDRAGASRYTNNCRDLSLLSNHDLLARLKLCAGRERQATAELIVHLAEVDARRLYAVEGCSSLFTFCTHVLHLSEHAAYLRIEAARAARRYPEILGLLAEGAVHLTAIGLLAPHLTPENHRVLLGEAKHKSKREIELVVARLCPKPQVQSSVQKLPQPRAAQAVSPGLACGGSAKPEGETPPPLRAPAPFVPPARPAVVAPLSPERYKVQFTASAETCEKLRRAQDLLRHQIPDGDPAEIFDGARSSPRTAAAVRRPACSSSIT